jgi:hypothetical protein
MKIVDAYRREWLNEDTGLATVQYEVEIMKYNQNSDSAYMHAYLSISDCTRQIQLEFGPDDDDSMENSLKKLALLRSVITEFEEKLIAANEKYQPLVTQMKIEQEKKDKERAEKAKKKQEKGQK